MNVEMLLELEDDDIAKHVFSAITPENKAYSKVKITSTLKGNILCFKMEGPKLHTTVSDLVDSAEVAARVVRIIRSFQERNLSEWKET